MATTRIACVRQEDEDMLTYFKTHNSAMVFHLPPQRYEHMQHAADEVLARLLRSISGKTALEILDSNAEGVLEDVRTLRVTHGATGQLITRLAGLLETQMDASTTNYEALKNTISTLNGKINSLQA
ncbi:hypothetical protein A2U01_0045280, partial [Trifolium medium]|nr:hypothetical protein [Trifolium medium]